MNLTLDASLCVGTFGRVHVHGSQSTHQIYVGYAPGSGIARFLLLVTLFSHTQQFITHQKNWTVCGSNTSLTFWARCYCRARLFLRVFDWAVSKAKMCRSKLEHGSTCVRMVTVARLCTWFSSWLASEFRGEGGPPRFQHLDTRGPSHAVPLHNIWCDCRGHLVVLKWRWPRCVLEALHWRVAPRETTKRLLASVWYWNFRSPRSRWSDWWWICKTTPMWGCREHSVCGCWHSSGRDCGRCSRECWLFVLGVLHPGVSVLWQTHIRDLSPSAESSKGGRFFQCNKLPLLCVSTGVRQWIHFQSPAAPIALLLPRGLVVTLGTPPTRRWGLRTNPSPTQVMSPKTTTSWTLRSSPAQSPWPSNSSLSKGSSRTWITMTPRSRRCFMTHTENKSFTPSEKACLLVSRRRPCPKERRDPLFKEQGDPLWQEVRS